MTDIPDAEPAMVAAEAEGNKIWKRRMTDVPREPNLLDAVIVALRTAGARGCRARRRLYEAVVHLFRLPSRRDGEARSRFPCRAARRVQPRRHESHLFPAVSVRRASLDGRGYRD